MPYPAPLTVLLIEDNPLDAELVQEAVMTCALPWRLTHVPDTNHALRALATLRPDLVLTDRCPPGPSRCSWLMQLRLDERLRDVPIVVLAGAMAPFERAACLANHAQAVLEKPEGFLGYLELVRDLNAHWGHRSD